MALVHETPPTERAAAPGELLDDVALIRRLLDHIDAGTTDLADDTWAEPVTNYRSPERLAAEVEHVLRRQPSVLCPSAALPEPGSYLARDAAGVPLLAARGRDGQVRAFRNACRHRGTALASGTGCAPSLMCPYHGWVYGLDGGLRHVPDEHGFPGLDREGHGLVPVPAEERAGLVFVTQDVPAGSAPPALDVAEAIVDPDAEVVRYDDNGEIGANWKVFLEGFLEGYHLKATHRNTFLPFGYDNVNVVETLGRHCRVSFPFRRIETLRDRPSSEWRRQRMGTFVHHLFPNAVVVEFSHHTNVFVLEPLAVDRTRVVSWQLTTPRPEAEAEERDEKREQDDARRDVDFVAQGAIEDFDMAARIQRGFASGANEALTFGRFEGALTHLHRQLHDLLDPASTD
jgi:phenylpropionate dioxygenase-like ring-hydroxylating dioxygenase large terminal subunit